MSTTENQHLRSKYSDQQLTDALITATELRERIFIRGTVGADGAYGSQHWSEDQINDLHAILNVLETLSEDSQGTDVSTEPSHRPWQRAESIDDVRPGDEIKVETEGFIGVYGVPVERVGHDTKVIIFTSGDYFHWDDDFVVSRIPAAHPNPELHWFIRCNRTKTILQATPEGKYLDNLGTAWPPSNFKDWTPMNVVEAAGTESDG